MTNDSCYLYPCRRNIEYKVNALIASSPPVGQFVYMHAGPKMLHPMESRTPAGGESRDQTNSEPLRQLPPPTPLPRLRTGKPPTLGEHLRGYK